MEDISFDNLPHANIWSFEKQDQYGDVKERLKVNCTARLRGFKPDRLDPEQKKTMQRDTQLPLLPNLLLTFQKYLLRNFWQIDGEVWC